MKDRHVGLIADKFCTGSGVVEGGAERHMYRFALALSHYGVDCTIYQPGTFNDCFLVDGIRVRQCPVNSRRLWSDLSQVALEDGATHLFFKYLECVPRGLRREMVSAAQHGIYWDIPFVSQYRFWYPFRLLAPVYLPIWRVVQLMKSIVCVRRVSAVVAMDTSFMRLVQSIYPEVRDRLFVTHPFSDVVPSSESGSMTDLPSAFVEAVIQSRNSNTFIVLVPRNLSFSKGASWLYEVVRLVNVERQALFVVVGDVMGNRHMKGARARISKMVQIAGADRQKFDNVLFLGSVRHALIPLLLSEIDAVVIPTFGYEGSCLAAAEAMSCGKVVVGTNVGGLNDTIENGFTGIVTRASPKDIAEGILRLATDGDLLARLGKCARAKAENCFELVGWERAQIPFFIAAGWVHGSRSI